MSAAPRHVVIAGRDAALWLTAAAIQRALAPAGVTVTALELPSALTPASTYVSLPAIEALHVRLGIDEAALLRDTRGSFTLGHNVAGPGAAPFFLAHGSYGAPIDGQGFFPFWVKARRFGLGAALEDFSPTAMAARQGRMLLPDAATEVFGRTDYGYHLPGIAYAGVLKTRAARLGVTLHQTHGVAVERDGDTIRALVADGERIGGDLFVDAGAGFHDDADREDWGDGFVTDRVLIARTAPFSSIPAYTELRAGPNGWLSLQASQAATHVAYAFVSTEQDDAAALAVAGALAGLPLGDAMVQVVSPGRDPRPWHGNTIAIGEAACTFDPLFGLDLHAIQLGIVHLLSLFPAGPDFAAERDEYNRIVASSFDRLREFQSTFYALNQFGASEFWANAREAAVPPEVAHKIATFRARGDIAPMEDETFAPDLWQALFAGLGEMPESWPPAIDRTPPERMKEDFRRILGFIKDKVLEQPTHDAYLATLCRSEAA